MATTTRERTRDSRGYGAGTGAIVGAAVAGAAVGVAATIGRKLFVQFAGGATGDWLEALKAEHQAALALFDKLQATDDSQTMIRTHLLSKLKHALGKHANEEENIIYPALREAGERRDADHLNSDHGYVKTYLYELEGMDNDDPAFLARVADFRSMLEKHIREEENEIFPRLKSRISEEKSAELTALLNKEGFKFA
jgi:hemerythrin superfamily protein